MLNKEYVKKFQKLHKEDISPEEALGSFQQLTTLVKIIYQPIRKEDFERMDKK